MQRSRSMVYYRRMGNVEQHLGNTMSTSMMHQLRGLWKSPRGTVLRIETLALVAIAVSFFLAFFGSCRRWSNRWILQKGFLAANALFLSLGTYSIGLMQSSSVKSEMYPIWASSLFALLSCVDSVTMFSFDNKSLVWKMLYQLCLYSGYVLLMSISTISSDVGNIAICVLSTITFLKGFHRSMALLLPSRMRDAIKEIQDDELFIVGLRYSTREEKLMVHVPLEDSDFTVKRSKLGVELPAIDSIHKGGELRSDVRDVCLSLSLSHLLQLRLLGLHEDETMLLDKSVSSNWLALTSDHGGGMEWAFKVVEVELAFLYDTFFTSNAFLHYYEAKTASVWLFASLVGICFVGVVAIMPRTRTARGAASSTTVVDTTPADLAITGVILVSLALLQVVHLLRCWTSNWARVALACDHARRLKKAKVAGGGHDDVHLTRGWCMRLRELLLRINWFESYLWQGKLGQHSVVESTGGCLQCECFTTSPPAMLRKCCSLVTGMLGFRYVRQGLQETLCGSGIGLDSIRLHPDVKASIADFLSRIASDDASAWPSPSLGDERRMIREAQGESELSPDPVLSNPYFQSVLRRKRSASKKYTSSVLTWHIATCYCELLAQRRDDEDFHDCCGTDAEKKAALEKDRRVATALSRYCAYLVASSPELLPGPPIDTKKVYAAVARRAREELRSCGDDQLGAMDKMKVRDFDALLLVLDEGVWMDRPFDDGVLLGKELRRKPPPDRWKELAEFWVKALVYAAPSDNAEEHMQRLAQGGEFITHVWALLSHAGIRRWVGGLEEPEPAANPVGAGPSYSAFRASPPRRRLRRPAA